MNRREVVINEMKQITLQYRAEVGSRRKPWPKSVIVRVAELVALGVTYKQVSDLTGVPYYSILNWRHRGSFQKLAEKGFRELEVMPRPATVTEPLKSESRDISKSATVTVTTPEGYAVIVADIHHAVEILNLLKRRS